MYVTYEKPTKKRTKFTKQLLKNTKFKATTNQLLIVSNSNKKRN